MVCHDSLHATTAHMSHNTQRHTEHKAQRRESPQLKTLDVEDRTNKAQVAARLMLNIHDRERHNTAHLRTTPQAAMLMLLNASSCQGDTSMPAHVMEKHNGRQSELMQSRRPMASTPTDQHECTALVKSPKMRNISSAVHIQLSGARVAPCGRSRSPC